VYVSSLPVGEAGLVAVRARSDAGPEAFTVIDQRADAGFQRALKVMVGDGLVVRLEAPAGTPLVVDAVAALPLLDTSPPTAPDRLDVTPHLSDAGPFVLTWTDGADDLPPPASSQTAWRTVGASEWTGLADAGAVAPELRVPPQEGAWEFGVRSVDRSGNASAWTVSAPVRLDLTPPTTPQNVEAVRDGAVISVSWSPSSDAVTAVEGYEVERTTSGDVTQTAETMSTRFDDPTPPAGPTTWRVRARDTVGRWSDWSAPSAPLAPVTEPLPSARYAVGCGCGAGDGHLLLAALLLQVVRRARSRR
jgi:hypothetical protein